MSTPLVLTFTIAVEALDTSLLPEDARTRGTPRFREAVRAYVEDQFRTLSGWHTVSVGDTLIEVRWTPDGKAPDPLDQIIAKLQAGDYPGSILLLRLLLSDRPRDVAILYNLGMALSDVGQLTEAERCLREALRLAPDSAHAWVALGVALHRSGRMPEAADALRQAVRIDPENPWAQRNFGASLASTGDVAGAERHFQAAVHLNPRDQQAWFGLAQTLETLERPAEADQAYCRLIDTDEYSQLAELARQARNRLAHMTFRNNVQGDVRPDAVMYCLSALEQFAFRTPADIRGIGYEIALLGTRGLDVNDPVRKYRLRSLPGEFSGLHLVCLMYVAFQAFQPDAAIGFDLSKEYGEARRLYRMERPDS